MSARRRTIAVIAAAAVVVAAAVALPLFQPWRIFTDKVVDEAVPGAGPISMTSSSPVPPTVSDDRSPRPSTPPATTQPTMPSKPTPAATVPVRLSGGRLISHEHTTTGTVSVLRLPDGSRILRLEGLDTSDGPDLKVWITDAPVIEGRDGWHVFDDGLYRNLGALKGNHGNQNYVIPADVDLAGFRSVAIWCDRFNVSFGAAALTAT